MGTAVGREADTVALFARLAEAPHEADFYQTLRRLECLFESKPRWGHARKPADEAVRFGQEPDLWFAPAPLASFSTKDGRPRLQVRLFGLRVPNGPLPLHITGYARERLRQHGDPTLTRFLDIFPSLPDAVLSRVGAGAAPRQSRSSR